MANRFFIPANEKDKETLGLRGIHGGFMPENDTEQRQCQEALLGGASKQLKQAEPSGNGLWNIYFDRKLIGSVCQKSQGFTAYGLDESFAGSYESLAMAAAVL